MSWSMKHRPRPADNRQMQLPSAGLPWPARCRSCTGRRVVRSRPVRYRGPRSWTGSSGRRENGDGHARGDLAPPPLERHAAKESAASFRVRNMYAELGFGRNQRVGEPGVRQSFWTGYSSFQQRRVLTLAMLRLSHTASDEIIIEGLA